MLFTSFSLQLRLVLNPTSIDLLTISWPPPSGHYYNSPYMAVIHHLFKSSISHIPQDAESRSRSFKKVVARECTNQLTMIVESWSVSPSRCDVKHYCSIQSRRTSRWNDRARSIAMIIAKDFLNRDEAREQASSNATRVAKNHCKFERNESCAELVHVRPRWKSRWTIKSSNARANEAQRLKRGDSHGCIDWLIDKIDQYNGCESAPTYGNEDCQIRK